MKNNNDFEKYLFRGQWTGFTFDEFEGSDEIITTKIFEGDKFRYRLYDKIYESVVIFKKGCFGFMENNYFFPLHQLSYSEGDLEIIELIGSIHEESK